MIRFAIAAMGIAAACGRISFDPRPSNGDARRSDAIPGDVIPPGDVVTGDGAMACIYLDSCSLLEVTCCTPMSTTCIPNGSMCSGTRADCDLMTNQGCDVAGGALCCKLASDPAGRCYNPPPC